MKKNTLTLALLLAFTGLVSAQELYVSPNSYMFVQDEVVFVTNDVRLENTDSYLYLRDGAQLVQDNDIKNSDAGALSVYQDQTVGVYEYNYWNSPVGLAPDGTTRANTASDKSLMFDPADNADPSNVNSTAFPFIGGYNSTDTQIAEFWIYNTESSYDYWGWNAGMATNPALGFTLKGRPTRTTIDYRGRPKTGNMTVNVDWNGTSDATQGGSVNYDGLQASQVETLVGNPYPSTLDLKMFLRNVNNIANLESAIYFWQQKAVGSHNLHDYEGGYGVWVPGVLVDDNDHGTFTPATFTSYNGDGQNNGGASGSGTAYSGTYSRRYAAIGQGFMVRNINGLQNATAEFDNSMRLYVKDSPAGVDIFARASSEDEEIIAMSHNGLDYMDIVNNPTRIPEIRIHSKIADSYYRESVIAFRNGTDLSFKPTCDARIAQKLASDTYFVIDENDLSIKSITYDIDARLPFGIVVANDATPYSITVNSLTHVDENIDVFMHDKLNDSYTDIKNGTFEVTLDQGTYNDRFVVVFRDAYAEQEEALNLEEEEITSSFNVFQNNDLEQLIISNPKSHTVKSFTMYDAAGKQIFNNINLGNDTEYTFPTASLSSGVYIVKVITDQDFNITKKVTVK
ncbi:T9SS type A sorting domain-containing protein [Pseudofulvibacter geojedonensis]|uniref:T9SS type A sorting domain-containing protein n=1 Tax=Pseudofulvibacter geojedonensis TaxID=1123758 RepID=A0ABW3HZG8_9FLAO